MTRGVLCILAAAFVGAGCQSDSASNSDEPRVPNHIGRKQRASDHGLKFFPGIGWRYIRPGSNPEVLRMAPVELVEHAKELREQGKWGEAMFAARAYLDRRPYGDSAEEMHILIAEVYEERDFDSYAFQEYQRILDKHPDYEKIDEVMDRMYAIAGKYKDGKWFKWKLPWQESAGIPIGPSMLKTAGLYTQIVTNAPYGSLAAQAQFHAGEAHQNALKGFKGFFASENEYANAVKAYQSVEDRYAPRPGDAPLANPDHQQELEVIIAKSRFRVAELYKVQANEGIYDQSMTRRAIAAYKDFLAEYEQKKAAGELTPEVVEMLEGVPDKINEMYWERVRGLTAIGEFYERNEKWVAATKYYAQIDQIYNSNPDLEPYEQARYTADGDEGRKTFKTVAYDKISDELIARRVQAGLAAVQSAAEYADNPTVHERLLARARLNLTGLISSDQNVKEAIANETYGFPEGTYEQFVQAQIDLGVVKKPEEEGPAPNPQP